jgi:serine/threonine protein kinase
VAQQLQTQQQHQHQHAPGTAHTHNTNTHRDIKLENLFISTNGHLQLGDFGLAISVLEERAISPVGTLEYMVRLSVIMDACV